LVDPTDSGCGYKLIQFAQMLNPPTNAAAAMLEKS
jgi:hypothetical protein